MLIWGISTVEATLTGAGTNLAFAGLCRPLPLAFSGSSQMSRARSGFVLDHDGKRARQWPVCKMILAASDTKRCQRAPGPVRTSQDQSRRRRRRNSSTLSLGVARDGSIRPTALESLHISQAWGGSPLGLLAQAWHLVKKIGKPLRKNLSRARLRGVCLHWLPDTIATVGMDILTMSTPHMLNRFGGDGIEAVRLLLRLLVEPWTKVQGIPSRGL